MTSITDAVSQTLVANVGTAQQTSAAVLQQCYAQAIALCMQNTAAP
ncbi:RebB family R body protein [uncultured Tateyamaria sp.]|nr:RebB family R body protein [uncultured Tateyamaria sp.]